MTGSHDLKSGVESRNGFFQESFVMHGDMVRIMANGVPNSIRLYNTPLTHRENLNPDPGWYLQDTWKISRRIALNPGIRFEHMSMTIPAQGAPGGTWVGARSFPAQNGLVDWNTWSPRLGAAWDVFGDGKTAVRGGVSKYDRLEGTTLVQDFDIVSFVKTFRGFRQRAIVAVRALGVVELGLSARFVYAFVPSKNFAPAVKVTISLSLVN